MYPLCSSEIQVRISVFSESVCRASGCIKFAGVVYLPFAYCQQRARLGWSGSRHLLLGSRWHLFLMEALPASRSLPAGLGQARQNGGAHSSSRKWPKVGSYEYDVNSGEYQVSWPDWASFLAWREQEQVRLCIELRLVNTYQNSPEYVRKLRYVCSRAGTGGKKAYTKKFPDRTRKVESKRTSCKCCLLVKEYPGISTVLGNYFNEHDHPLGNENLRHTRMSKETREYIAALLRLGVAPEHIVSQFKSVFLGLASLVMQLKTLHRGVYNSGDVIDQDTDDNLVATRNEFLELKDIRRIEKDIEKETVQLHPDDGRSTLLWVANLREKGHLLGFKSKTDPPPAGSGLEANVFTLSVQTGWQRKMFRKYGVNLFCIDATFNVTMYENLNLTTIVVRDHFGHGTLYALFCPFQTYIAGHRYTRRIYVRL